jgi:hypothetical protein
VNTIFKITAVLITVFASQAHAAFMDDYVVKNWHKSINQGAINTSKAPDSIKLTSSDSKNPKFFGERNQDFTIASVGNGLVTFDWSYKTNDQDGPEFDPFGWLLNGVFTKLTNDNGKIAQSGTFQVKVRAGDIFGFRANSSDSMFGSATTTVSNFSAPSQVPVPAAFWLMGAPLFGLLGKKRSFSA